MLARGCQRALSLVNLLKTHRGLSTAAASELDACWSFTPNFLNQREQDVLLAACLQKLDDAESGSARRRRRRYSASMPPEQKPTGFLPDEYYQFEEGHHDRVIRRYREMHLSSWPTDEAFSGLQAVVERIEAVCPTKDLQTHLLHLASDGEILPHIDNLEASGSWILGVTLGGTRTLRLHHPDTAEGIVDVSLPPGSLYIQRDALRYKWQHSILPSAVTDKTSEGTSMISQRLSVMFRVSFNFEVGVVLHTDPEEWIRLCHRIGYLLAKHLVRRIRPSLSDDAPPMGRPRDIFFCRSHGNDRMISLTAPVTSRDRRVFAGGSAKRPWLHHPDDLTCSKVAATRQAPPFTQPRDQRMRRYSSVPDPINDHLISVQWGRNDPLPLAYDL